MILFNNFFFIITFEMLNVRKFAIIDIDTKSTVFCCLKIVCAVIGFVKVDAVWAASAECTVRYSAGDT